MSKLVRLVFSILVFALGLCSSMLPAFAQPMVQAGQVFSQRAGGNSAARANSLTLPSTTASTAFTPAATWAGFEVGSGSGNGFKGVEANWNAPCTTGPTNGQYAYGSWVGLGGDFNFEPLEQTGIALQPNGTYQLFWEYVPDPQGPHYDTKTTDVVHCGDHLTAWIHYGSSYCPNGGWDSWIQDNSQPGVHWNHPCDASKPYGVQSAEWIDERPLDSVNCPLKLADFNYTSWSNVLAQSNNPGAQFENPNSFVNQHIVMESDHLPLAQPDNQSVSSNNTFIDRWHDAGQYCVGIAP